MKWALALALCVLAASCIREVSPVERGQRLAADPAFARSSSNEFACTTCHAARDGENPRNVVFSGAPLAGSTLRPSYWGGTVTDLREAVEICYRKFMRGGDLDPTRDDTIALYAYLESLSTGAGVAATAVPFTVTRSVAPPEGGDAARGADLYARACGNCHGDLRTGARRLGELPSIVPDDTEQEHNAATGYNQVTLRQVFVQKIRHGSFLSYAGSMPPFSEEALSDAQIADILAYIDPRLR